MTDSNSAYIDWKNWDSASFGRFDALQAAYFAAETGIRHGAGLRVLEVGFGNGSFLSNALFFDIFFLIILSLLFFII